MKSGRAASFDHLGHQHGDVPSGMQDRREQNNRHNRCGKHPSVRFVAFAERRLLRERDEMRRIEEKLQQRLVECERRVSQLLGERACEILRGRQLPPISVDHGTWSAGILSSFRSPGRACLSPLSRSQRI